MSVSSSSFYVVFRRVAAGAGAYGYAQAVTVGTQLVSLPFFLHYWDMVTYGYWLALTALPFYLSLADAGISTASCNQIIALITQKKIREANEVFQSAVVFLLVVSLCILCAVGAVLLMLPTSTLNASEWKIVFLLLSCSVVLGLFCSLAEIIYKATGGYAAGTYLVTTVRLVECGAGLVGLVLTKSFIGVAVAAFAARFFYTLFCIFISQRRTDFLSWGVGHASLRNIKLAAKPGLLFFSLSMTNALSLQGFTLLVAATLGPAATTVFNTYRTIARIVVQLTNALSNPLWPELTALKGQNDERTFWKIYRRGNAIGLLIAGGGALIVYFISPFILKIWTHGQITFTATYMALFLAYAAVCSAAQVPRVVLMSINCHSGLAWKSLLASFIALVGAWLFWRWGGMEGVVVAMLLGETLVLLAAIRDVHHLHKTKA